MKNWLLLLVIPLCLFVGMVIYAVIDDVADRDVEWHLYSVGVGDGCYHACEGFFNDTYASNRCGTTCWLYALQADGDWLSEGGGRG